MDNTGVKTFLSVLLIWVFCLSAGGQVRLEDKYTVFPFKLEEGLPCNYVDDLLRDHYGFLWVLTSGGGACRFDGNELIVFDASSTPALSSNFTRNAVEDSFGRLWISSEGGLDVLDLETLQKAPLALPEFSPGGPSVCSFVSMDAKGNIWTKFGSTIYCLLLDSEGGIADCLSFTHEGLRPVNMVFEDVEQDGTLWVSLDGIVHNVSIGRGNALEAVPIPDAPDLGRGTYVSDYLKVGPQVWISTENGLYRFYMAGREWKHYVSEASNPHSLTQNFVTSLALTSDGDLLASTLHGLNLYNALSDDFDRIGTSVINCIKTAGSNISVATEDQGFMVLSPKRLDMRDFSHSAADPSSIAQGAVNAVWQEENGRLWVGSVEGGISIMESSSGRFIHLTSEGNGLSHNSISTLSPGPGETLFAGTWGGGIDVVSTKPPYKVLRHLPAGGPLTEYVGMLEYDASNGLLWIGSNQGIYTLDLSDGTFASMVDEAADGVIGSCLDSKGRLWMGCLRGVYVFDLRSRDSSGRFSYTRYCPGEKVCCVAEGSGGTMYLGSNGGGLFHAKEAEGEGFDFKAITSRNGLSNNNVRGISKDASGYIWISTEHGLNRLDPESGNLEYFLRRDGLGCDNFYWNNACEGTDGMLYFGHADGLSVLDPSRFSETTSARPLLFTCISVDNIQYRNPYPRQLVLHERNLSITFRFSFVGPGPNTRYRYCLAGKGQNWQSLPEGEQSVTFSGLSGGKYTFMVEGLDAYGNISGSISLPVKVRRYFYHTWWFNLLLSATALYLGWLVLKWRTRVLRRRQEELEEIVGDRTREISEQKKLVEKNVEELHRQNEALRRQNEELASQKLLFSPERRTEGEQKEDRFRGKVLGTLRTMYKDPDLDVGGFCQAMGSSKTLLNSRLQEAFGQSIGQLIRTYRLTVAREMLESGAGLNVSEVAYEAGFNDPKYFTRCFTKEFGFPPSTIAKQ